MENHVTGLKTLGFDEWFRTRANNNEQKPARVTAVHKESYVLNGGGSDIHAELSGKMLYGVDSALDLPAVGDWVSAEFHDDNTFAIIHGLIERKTLLKRKTPGKQVQYQLIAANVDVALIIQSLDDNFNLRRLERYLVMVNESRIRPMLLLSKNDLMNVKDTSERIARIHEIMPGLTILPFSNLSEASLSEIDLLLKPGLTYCLLGSSGVGKTTLLNNLLGEALFATLKVRSNDSRGRHATTARQMVILENGAMIIDTPGMRELGNIGVDEGMNETFSEIDDLANGCRFSDCTHQDEIDCAVKAAVDDGRLPADRYENFLKLVKETAYYSMSYNEKRNKDRQFGKFLKNFKKQNYPDKGE